MKITLLENLYSFMIVSCLILLRMRSFSEKYCFRENQNTLFIQKHFTKHQVVYDMTLKNMVQPDRP